MMTTSYPYLMTFSGKKFNPLDPNIDDICLEDIAHGLSNVCRFGGQCKQFYSVAQHSVYLSDYYILEDATMPPKNSPLFILMQQALMHDAAEAYLGDMLSMLKHCGEFEFYRELERKLERLIFRKFGIPYPVSAIVKDIDHHHIIYAERRRLYNEWDTTTEYADKLPELISLWNPPLVEILFLDRCADYGIK